MNLSEQIPTGSDRQRSRGREEVARAFAWAAALYLCARWVAGYETGDYDDKAVHYYSAARLYAAPEARRLIDQHQSDWLSRAPATIRFRTENRLSSYWVYPLPSSLLRGWCAIYRAPGEAPRSFSLPFRNAVFMAHLLALGLILGLAWRFPISGSVVMLVLVAASFPSLHPEWLAGAPDVQPHHLQSGPRDSAILVLVAACFAFIQGRRRMAILGFFLMFAWHAGAGLIAAPVALASFALSRLGVSRHPRLKTIVVGSLLALTALATPLLERGEQPRLWVPMAVIGFSALVRIPRRSMPFLTALLVTAGYLYLSQLVLVAFGLPGVEHSLIRMENNLIAEVPDRLEGFRQVAAVALLTVLVAGIAHAVMLHRAAPRVQMAALLAAEMGMLLLAVGAHRGIFPALASRDLPFFAESDAHVARLPIDLLTRETLGENPEATFFASLGDFLICCQE